MAKKSKTSKRSTRKTARKPSATKKKSAAKKSPARKKKKKAPAKKKSASRKKKKPAASASRKSPGKKKKSKRRSPEKRLQDLDSQILKLANERAGLTTEVIQKGDDPQAAVFSPAQDDELLQRITEENDGPLPDDTVRRLFREILSAAKRKVKLSRVAYLGPPLSFTHLAAVERFGTQADLVPVNTIAAVFETVNRGHAEFGIVPIENSTDGRVVDTLDMFTKLPLRICGEVQISVHHNLLSRCPRSEISEIYSKPQALSQCRDWLARNMPQARLIEVTSTSAAAQLARDKPGAAAIASLPAAVEYGLQTVAQDIQDNRENVTRFAVIGDEVSRRTGHDRTALLLKIPHEPGSLSDALVAFKKNKVNLTWIESFPLQGENGAYQFFLDFEGHVDDAKVKRTLSDLEKKADLLEVLGSYPRSEASD